MKPKNIILIMTDQLRGDCLGCMGHPDVKTPFLDTLASRGTLFDRAYSSCPTCIPARAALHTGMSQERHGRVGYADGVDWDYPHTMAGELKSHGYYTQCIGKMHVHPLRNYLGFDHVELHDGYLHYYRYSDVPWYESQKNADDYMHWLKNEKGIDADVIDTGMECNSWVARPWMYEENTHPTNWVTGRAIDFLRRRDRSQPFFLMVSYLRPHPPFDAPKYYFDLYNSMELRAPAVGGWESSEALERCGRIFDSATGPKDPELIRQAMVGYYACITHLDHQIGRFIQALVDDKCYDDSIILFTSDHGEELCDHHLFRKAMPYEGSAHIPMIISGKAALSKDGGPQVCHSVVELRDVMPTVLEMAGVPVPESVDGSSMLPLVRETDKTLRDWLHGEHSFGDKSNHWIVTKTDKYIWFSQTGEEQYFDLSTDPRELNNKIGDPDCKERIAYLRNLLIQALTGREEGYTDGYRLMTGRTPACVLEHPVKK
ncbi:MAG: arylsulfatase [Clostridiales bacterium]|nr:arylsulfatase [Clostridiales bacterium]